MHDALFVRGIQRVSKLYAYFENAGNGQRSVRQQVVKRLAFQQLHGDKSPAVVLFDGVNGANAGMVQRRGGARFANEVLERRGVLVGLGGQKFKSDAAAQPGVLRLVDHTHASTADFAENLIMRDELAFHAGCETTNGRRCHKSGQRSSGDIHGV